jgi:hypothetical protein
MGVMRSARRTSAVLAGLLLAATMTACSSGSDGGPAPDSTAKPVKWPRYWATEEQAETGSQDVNGTDYFAAYDEASVVYNGQDVVRFLDPKTGKPNHPAVILKDSKIVCGAQPRRRIEDHRALVVVGFEGYGRCKDLVAYDTRTGKQAWSYGYAGKATGSIFTDQRDGTVLFAAGSGYVAGLDSGSGKVRWEVPAADLVLGDAAKSARGCSSSAALAADRPVVIASLGCRTASGEKRGIWGLDLKTGKKLWHTDDWTPKASFGPRPHPVDGRFFATQVNAPAWLSSKTGKLTRLTMKKPRQRLPEAEEIYSSCDDMRGGSSSSPSHQSCIWSNGKTLVLSTTMTRSNRFAAHLEGFDPVTNRSLWTWDEKGSYDPDKHEFDNGYAPIGFTDDGKEFRIIHNSTKVLRLSATDGHLLGRGILSASMNLLEFGLSGPGFILMRSEGGILDAKSGLWYFRTAA